MRAVLQRVEKASVAVAGKAVSAIGPGWLILLGVGKGDTEQDIPILAEKVANLRVFADAEGKFNLSVLDIKGEFLVVSQFTLLADCRKGRRPSFQDAAPPEEAEKLYEKFVAALKQFGRPVGTGVFGANMAVSLVNDGPVTILLDTKNMGGEG